MRNMVKGAAFDVVLSISVILFIIPIVHAGQPCYNIPANIDNTANYLFFYHNYYVEINGSDGECRYYDLLNTFAKKNVVVVSELRPEVVDPLEYAAEATKKVQSLLDAGVPPGNITISGHSKGGVIALQIAAQIQQPEIRYIILAGCGIKPLAYAYPEASVLRGDFLSLFANSDRIAGSCDGLLRQSPQGVSSKEIILDSSEGHWLFFKPDSLWLSPFSLMLAKVR